MLGVLVGNLIFSMMADRYNNFNFIDIINSYFVNQYKINIKYTYTFFILLTLIKFIYVELVEKNH